MRYQAVDQRWRDDATKEQHSAQGAEALILCIVYVKFQTWTSTVYNIYQKMQNYIVYFTYFVIKTSKSAIQFKNTKFALSHTSYNYNKVSYCDDVPIVSRITTNAMHYSIKLRKGWNSDKALFYNSSNSRGTWQKRLIFGMLHFEHMFSLFKLLLQRIFRPSFF